MARISPVSRESVPEDQRYIFDTFVPQGGPVPAVGPYYVLRHVPEVANRGAHLWNYLRLESSLSLQAKELAVIVTARETDCLFVWNIHAAAARRAGLKDDLVDNIRDRKELANLTSEEAAVVYYGQEYFRTNRVSRDTFDAALAQFGVRGLIELTNLMGCYAMWAFNVNAFEVDLPEDRTEPVLPV